MTASKNRIEFLINAGASDVDIAGDTGIPRSTIGFVRRGERSLPSQYINPLRNMYRKVNYHILRAEAMSYSQARRYSSSSVKDATGIAVEMRMMVTQSTRGAITGKVTALEKKGILPDLKQVQKDMLAAVRKGYMKSHKDFIQWQDYFMRKEEFKLDVHAAQEQALKDLGW